MCLFCCGGLVHSYRGDDATWLLILLLAEEKQIEADVLVNVVFAGLIPRTTIFDITTSQQRPLPKFTMIFCVFYLPNSRSTRGRILIIRKLQLFYE